MSAHNCAELSPSPMCGSGVQQDVSVRELVEQMKISIVYITTKQMVADLLTKAVSKLTFETLVGSLFGKEM